MTGIIKHDQELMKKNNRQIIIDLIREKRPISRADLAKLTNMSPTSVSRIVTELCELGLIKETELTSSGVGRKALLLDTVSNCTFVVSVELDQEMAKIAIVDFDANFIAEQYVYYNSQTMGWEGIIDKLCKSIEEIIEKTKIDKSKIIGVGFGIPGIIDTNKGIVVFSPQLGWKDIKLVSYIEKKLVYKTTIDNIIKLKALGENIHGSTKGYKRAALINFGTGVGSALIVNEEIYRGITNSAGEIGHTTIDPNGRLCHCGRRGCLQTYITDWALIQDAKMVKDVTDVKEIFTAASNEEGWAVDILDRLYTYVGIAVCDVIYMYNPDTVIISGKLIEEEPDMRDIIIDRVKELIWEPFKGTYNIKFSSLGDKSGVLGVATLVLDKYFDEL